MYLRGFPLDYDYLRGFPVNYAFFRGLDGLGKTTNQVWVDNFQNPFNTNVLAPAAALAQTNKAGAYAMLAPAFAKIQQDAISFVAQYPPGAIRNEAQATIDRWKNSDFGLIEGFLNDWGAASAATTTSTNLSLPIPTTGPAPVAQVSTPLLSVATPAIAVPVSSGGGVSYLPAPDQSLVPTNASTPASVGTGFDLSGYLPWLLGAAALAFFLNSSRKRGTT
jgi:hypothetical protein